MKHGFWTVYFVTPSVNSDRRVGIPRTVLAVFCAVALFGMAGLARTAWFSFSYIGARARVHFLGRQNTSLLHSLTALEKAADSRTAIIKSITDYENSVRLKFGMNTIDDDVRLAGVGGTVNIEEILLASLEDPPVQSAGILNRKIESLLRQTALQDSTFARTAYHVTNQRMAWDQRPSIIPAPGRVTSGYGYRLHPFFQQVLFHEGIDISNRVWTPVDATADGIVSKVEYRNDYGNYVKIEHSASGYVTLYAHLERASVVEGQVVKRGEMIGYMGNTGRSTGPHVHYEVRKLGKYENPSDYFLPLNAVID